MVRELIDRVVRPSIDLPSVTQYKGVMLLGPPGVGKTYAVKAVKHLCRDWCKVSCKFDGLDLNECGSDSRGGVECAYAVGGE